MANLKMPDLPDLPDLPRLKSNICISRILFFIFYLFCNLRLVKFKIRTSKSGKSGILFPPHINPFMIIIIPFPFIQFNFLTAFTKN